MPEMTKSGIYAHMSYSPSLSRREVSLLAEWELARKRWVTIDDIRKEAGNEAAAKVASALVRKGALERLRPGLYLLHPFRLLKRGSAMSAPAALEVLLNAEPHYLGGLWAFTQNGLTEQQYVSRLDAFVARPRRGGGVPGAKVAFHVVSRTALHVGVVDAVVEGMRVPISDPERTLVDLLELPRIAGGLLGALELFQRALPRVAAGRVAEYASRIARTSTCQRIGLLLDRAGAPPSVLRRLSRRTTGTKSLISLQPGRRTGRVNTRWNVVENDDGLDSSPIA